MTKQNSKESQRDYIPCKYRDIAYRDSLGDGGEWRPESDLKSQRKNAKWERGFCGKITSKGIIHSYMVCNDFGFIGQCLPADTKIFNPLHVRLIYIYKRIYTIYTNLKIKFTRKVDLGIIHKTSWYLERRIMDLEIEHEKKQHPVNFIEIVNELKDFEKKFEQFIGEEKER